MRNDEIAGRTRGPAPPRQVVTLRLPTEVHAQLRAVSFFTGTTVNDIVLELITGFLATEGRRALQEAAHVYAESIGGRAEELEAGARAGSGNTAPSPRPRRTGTTRKGKARTG